MTTINSSIDYKKLVVQNGFLLVGLLVGSGLSAQSLPSADTESTQAAQTGERASSPENRDQVGASQDSDQDDVARQAQASEAAAEHATKNLDGLKGSDQPSSMLHRLSGSLLNDPDAPYSLRLSAELGFLFPVSHTIQFGNGGTKIDYVAEGGQDNLVPFARISADLELFDHHKITFLYQPLQLDTIKATARDIQVDEVVFRKGTPVRYVYGFDFWRLSYLYDFVAGDSTELGIGASLQIRNATIGFESLDGTQSRYKRNIGPVPVLKARAMHMFGDHFWIGAEADGFYAPIKYINGSDSDVEGAILDASVRAGLALTPGVESFVNLRYLGGGAVGTSNNDNTPGDGYSDNWLHFVSLSLGFTLG